MTDAREPRDAGAPTEPTDPVEPNTELPADRTLALHEINSIADTLRNQNLHVYTAAAFRRDRILGWLILCVILATLAWAIFYQYVSVNDLKHASYGACTDRNQSIVEQRRLYRELAAEVPDTRTSQLIAASASQMVEINCEKILH